MDAYTKQIQDVADHWDDKMPMMCMEECGELIQALSKYERQDFNGYPEVEDIYRQNIIDEIGDMYISLKAIMYHYGISTEKVVERIDYKLNKKYY